MYALATSRRSCQVTCEALAEATGESFLFIATRDQLTAEWLSSRGVKKVFLPHWSYRIPASVYGAFETIIFHMTDLPYGRGGSPLQNLIIRGHENTVITALRCVEDLDAGPVYLKRPLNLNGSADEVFLRADRIIQSMIVDIIRDAPDPRPQQGEPTVFTRRRPEDGDWSCATDLDTVFNYIRMLDAEGYPPAFIDVGPFRLDFSKASRKTDAVLADVRISVREKRGSGK